MSLRGAGWYHGQRLTGCVSFSAAVSAAGRVPERLLHHLRIPHLESNLQLHQTDRPIEKMEGEASVGSDPKFLF